MVSSAPAPLTNPPVSYAESVKKAHSPRSNAVRNSLGDFPTVSGASGISSFSSPPSNATSQLPKLLSSIEAIGGSQAGAYDFPELPTETSSQNNAEDHNEPTNHVHPNANNVPKAPPAVNVWTERLKEQMALSHVHVHQPQRQPRATATSSVGTPSVPHRLRPTGMGTSPVPSTSTSRSSPSQTMSLNGDDNDHDPFIVRMPSHLSRHSSSKSIRLVNDTDNWQEVAKPPSIDLGGSEGGEKPRSSESHAGTYNSSNSVDLSRKSSIDSTRHQSDSRPPSDQMSRLNSRSVFEGNSTGSHSVPYSRVESRAGSSASSPRLQVRGRRLPDDELTVVYDLRHEAPKVPYNPPRMSSRVPERTTYHHHTFSHPPDIASHYFRSPPIPPTIDAPLHSARLSPLLSAIRHPYYANPVSGHTSPTYAGSRPPSGAGTPPYPVYPPYATTCGYCHSRIPWDGFVSPIHPRPVPGFSTPLLQDEYIVPPPMHLSFFNPPFPDTTEPLPKTRLTQSERSYESSQDSHLPPAIVSRNMVFGSIDLTHDRIHQTPNTKEATREEGKQSIEQMAEQFSGFYIGVPPGEPVPPRQGHKKHSTKSLSRPSASPVAEATDNAKANGAPQDGCKVVDEQPNTAVGEDVSAPSKKWVFGTTAKFDGPNEASPLEDSRSTSSEHSPPPAEPAQPIAPLLDQHSPTVTAQPSGTEKSVTSPSSETQNGPSTMRSEDGSTTSDVWEVKDYGYGFGDVSGTDNATDVIRRAREARERQRQLEWQKEQAQIQLQKEQELQLGVQETHTQHTWQEAHEERELWDQTKEFGRGRPRRGSWAGSYGSHERGAYGSRRARGFGRYQGRHPGRGGYHHQQRSSLSSLTPPPQFNPLPLPGAGYMNGYVQIPSYTPPDYELYHPVPVTIPVNGAPLIPLPQSALSLPLDTTRSCLLSQLEYYLSSQNMAQDFFLRQRMDDQGWIPISLIASFNRVKKLTTEVNLVCDVLNLSSLTEVKGEYVRMAREQWKQFVLPNAPKSIVCHPIEFEAIEPQDDQVAYAQVQDGEIEEEGDTYGEDDDDEDIVFVIGEEAEGSWAPERRPAALEST